MPNIYFVSLRLYAICAVWRSLRVRAFRRFTIFTYARSSPLRDLLSKHGISLFHHIYRYTLSAVTPFIATRSLPLHPICRYTMLKPWFDCYRCLRLPRYTLNVSHRFIFTLFAVTCYLPFRAHCGYTFFTLARYLPIHGIFTSATDPTIFLCAICVSRSLPLRELYRYTAFACNTIFYDTRYLPLRDVDRYTIFAGFIVFTITCSFSSHDDLRLEDICGYTPFAATGSLSFHAPFSVTRFLPRHALFPLHDITVKQFSFPFAVSSSYLCRYTLVDASRSSPFYALPIHIYSCRDTIITATCYTSSVRDTHRYTLFAVMRSFLIQHICRVTPFDTATKYLPSHFTSPFCLFCLFKIFLSFRIVLSDTMNGFYRCRMFAVTRCLPLHGVYRNAIFARHMIFTVTHFLSSHNLCRRTIFIVTRYLPLHGVGRITIYTVTRSLPLHALYRFSRCLPLHTVCGYTALCGYCTTIRTMHLFYAVCPHKLLSVTSRLPLHDMYRYMLFIAARYFPFNALGRCIIRDFGVSRYFLFNATCRYTHLQPASLRRYVLFALHAISVTRTLRSHALFHHTLFTVSLYLPLHTICGCTFFAVTRSMPLNHICRFTLFDVIWYLLFAVTLDSVAVPRFLRLHALNHHTFLAVSLHWPLHDLRCMVFLLALDAVGRCAMVTVTFSLPLHAICDCAV